MMMKAVTRNTLIPVIYIPQNRYKGRTTQKSLNIHLLFNIFNINTLLPIITKAGIVGFCFQPPVEFRKKVVAIYHD